MQAVFLGLSLLCCSVVAEAELSKAASSDLLGTLSSSGARIVFDSTRSGSFGIYSSRLDGSDIRAIVDEKAWQEMYPDPTPDGRLVVFSRQRSTVRYAPSQVWIVRTDGTGARMLSTDGEFPTFSADGKKVFFERKANRVMVISVDGNNEQEFFPRGTKEFSGRKIIKPRVSPDEKFVTFTSDKPDRWNAWIAEVETGKGSLIERGCESAWFVDQQKVAWVKKSGARERSGIFFWDRAKDLREELQDADAPWGHEYFPTIAHNDGLLLYSACPPGEHDHANSNYQIFLKDISSGAVHRVTTDRFNNRWPKLIQPGS